MSKKIIVLEQDFGRGNINYYQVVRGRVISKKLVLIIFNRVWINSKGEISNSYQRAIALIRKETDEVLYVNIEGVKNNA